MSEGREVPVVWIQGGSCTGCSVSILNSVAPPIKDVLLDEILPGKRINLRFQATLMAGAGEPVIKVLEDTMKEKPGEYLLVVEGEIPTAEGGIYCSVGERGEEPIPFKDWVVQLGKEAMAVIALGTCACFGGIPAGRPNPTGAKGVKDVFEQEGVETPLINVPGCPPHPDWFIGTVARILLLGLPGPEDLDEWLRPKDFYGMLVHENCPRRAYFDEGKFAQKFGEPGCLYLLGCKGPITHADCPLRKWNGGVNWCIDSGMGCQGCTQPEFPDFVDPFYEKTSEFSAELQTFQVCFGCQTCTNVCPVVSQYERPREALGLLPHQIMALCALGLRERAFGASMLWRCITCYQCQKFCPQNVNVTEVLIELRGLMARGIREREKGVLPSAVAGIGQ